MTAETERYGRELCAARETVLRGNDLLAELQRQTADCGLELRRLEADRLERVDVTAAAERKAAERLARLRRSADEARERLADARARAADYGAKCELATEDRRRLQEAVDQEACRARARFERLAADRDRLAARLAEATAEADAAESERARLAADAVGQADRLARLTDEVGLMERRACHAQLLRSVRRSQRAAETALLGDANTVQRHRLATLRADLRELRAATVGRRERTAIAGPPGPPDGDLNAATTTS